MDTNSAFEIISHCAGDITTLRTLCLTSKTIRSFAIIHLFSTIHFTCAEDMTFWCEIVARTPALAVVVKTVKFWEPWEELGYRYERMGFATSTELRDISVMPDIPPFPTVEVVEYHGNGFNDTWTVIPHALKVIGTTLFPSIQKLQLASLGFRSFSELASLISACGRLKGLSFQMIRVNKGASKPEPPLPETAVPDLTTLEELWVKECNYNSDSQDCILSLIKEYSPSHLRTFTSEYFDYERYTCSVDSVREVLQRNAASLVNLVLDPRFPETQDEILDMFNRLPAFPALDSLTFWMSDNHWVEQVVNALEGAPNLTRLNFRLWLYHDSSFSPEGYDDVRWYLQNILKGAFPWGASESMKKIITRKFPSCRHIVFQLCVPNDSDLHFRRGARRRLEAFLRDGLEESGADIGDCLHLEWVNEEFQPVVYHAMNGKPAWGEERSDLWSEPETESSDCGEGSDSCQ
ncbi:hypothetical protein FB45DRAFT_1138937 [Roridomyces roridus]|uniref:Uncharacterized protein n=1 Tax=Roridomyces roridus TaxID=1738132 RepID=A0AAD7C3R6_9AGAR|nr:hypothetical protein FB45DRAFT_1138937 [Roridomyces roridus]